MLICAGLSPDLTCQEQLALLCQLMQANADDRGKMKKSIGKKAGELLSQKNKSSDSIRGELAQFIKGEIINKSELRRHRGK
jgi:hypothetical protein